MSLGSAARLALEALNDAKHHMSAVAGQLLGGRTWDEVPA